MLSKNIIWYYLVITWLPYIYLLHYYQLYDAKIHLKTGRVRKNIHLGNLMEYELNKNARFRFICSFPFFSF